MTEPHDHDTAPRPDGASEHGGAEPGPEWAPPTEPTWAAGPRASGAAGTGAPTGGGRLRRPSRTTWTVAGAVLAGLVLLGGGFGAGYAVADTTATPPAHTAGAAHPGKARGAKHGHRSTPGTPPAPGQPAPSQPGQAPAPAPGTLSG